MSILFKDYLIQDGFNHQFIVSWYIVVSLSSCKEKLLRLNLLSEWNSLHIRKKNIFLFKFVWLLKQLSCQVSSQIFNFTKISRQFCLQLYTRNIETLPFILFLEWWHSFAVPLFSQYFLYKIVFITASVQKMTNYENDNAKEVMMV